MIIRKFENVECMGVVVEGRTFGHIPIMGSDGDVGRCMSGSLLLQVERWQRVGGVREP